MTARARRLALFALLLAALAPGRPAVAQLTALGAIVLDECDAPGDCLANELFGEALAVCDFDDDGFDDLAVGVPEETVGPNDNAGSLHIYYGSPAGLSTAGELVLDLDDLDLSGGADAGDHLGAALAAGDFDRDGICDLAAGAPGKSVGAADNGAGAAIVLFGSPAGLVGDGFRFLSQNHLPPGSSESSEEGDAFGTALAALPDGGLAISTPKEDFLLPTDTDSGLVQIFSSSAPGDSLDSVVDREQNDFTAVCPDGNELNDTWGTALAVGRFSASASLVVGAEWEGVGSASNAGRITLIGAPADCFDQSSAGVLDAAEQSDRFGRALATGDFDDDGFDDLAIGAPGEEYDDVPTARTGGVNVLFGSADGLTSSGDLHFSQIDFPSGLEFNEGEERFGDALASGDFDGDGHRDLAIGVPHEEVDGVSEAGTVHAAYGDPAGFDTSRHQTFHSNFPAAMPDSPNANDHFGGALASGDFDGNGTDDLAIGMPGEGLGAQPRAGAVTVLYGLLRAHGAFGTVQFADNAATVSESADLELVFVTREGGAVIAAAVDHALVGGSATPGSDFTYSGGSETWDAGDLAQNFFVLTVEEDTLDEPGETVVIALSDASAGTALGTPATFTLTISDNDVAGNLSFAQPATAVAETAGTIQIPVVRDGGAASGVTVQFATSNNTAQAGLDYVATSGTLTFGAGETTRFIPVQILDDSLTEPGEVFHLTLSNPGGGGTLGTFTLQQIVILDDEIFLDGFESANTGAWSTTVP